MDSNDPPQGMSRARLLLVDDDAGIGRVVSRMLRDTLDVTVLTSAKDALERMTVAGERYDAIMCDLIMPDLTGMDFYDRLGAFDPRAAERIVFLTGGAFTRRAEVFLQTVRNRRIEKPFNRAALLEAVAHALEIAKL